MTTKTKTPYIVVVNYRMGNTASVAKAIEALGFTNMLSDKKSDVEKATHIILPGVGAFGDGMDNLKKTGLVDTLAKRVFEDSVPFLGICLGMQLLGDVGHEFGIHKGLGWISGEVVKLQSPRVPHIGWNDIHMTREDALFRGISDHNFYFVHSYYFQPKDRKVITSSCTYGETFPSSVRYGNIAAVQFHPEKSQQSGLMLLKNFLAI